MAKAVAMITSFNAGEFSPLLDGRVDIARYYSSAKLFENMIPLPAGGAKRRPGTYYAATTKDSGTRKSRLIPFQFSTTQAYNVEFGDKYFRFYANQGQLLASGTAYTLTSPYLEDDLFDIQVTQDADTMWIVHPSYKPRKLTRNAATWDSYTKLASHFDGADAAVAYSDPIAGAYTFQGTAALDTAQYKFNGSSLVLDGDSDYVTQGDSANWNFGTGNFTVDFWVRFASVSGAQTFVGQYEDATNYWYMSKPANDAVEMVFSDGGVIKASVFMTAGWTPVVDTWYHIEFVRNSTVGLIFIDGVSQTITESTPFSTNDVGDMAGLLEVGASNASNFLNGWIEEVRVSKGIARHTENFTPPTTAYAADVITFALANYAPELMTLDVAPGGTGWIVGDTITGVTSGETCVITTVLTTKTYNVKDRSGTFTDGEVLTNQTDTADQGAGFPAFTLDPFGADGSDDCPSCVTIHEQRLFFANTNNNPQKVWGSVSGDYEDMKTGSSDADAITYTIGSEQVNAIRWLSSGRILGMGTHGGVFSLSSGSVEAPLTPTNVNVKRETSYGTSKITPKKIGNFVYYFQRNLKTLREFAYSYDIEEYKAFDITKVADHITNGGIIDMDYQQSPYNILWCVRDDGELACLTRQIDEEVLAWSRQIIGGSFGAGNAVVESVSVIPGDSGDDEVWIIVKRTINSATVRYVEYFKPMDFGDEQEDAFFVDSGLSSDVPKPITDITKADPGVVTVTGHGFSNADIVILRGVLGMTEVNRTKYKVAGVSSDTFQLTDASTGDDIETTAFTTYISGGEARKCNTTLSGLDHLEAETVDIFLDGDTATTAVVNSSGAITITSPANGGGEVHAGLRFIPYIKTMRIEAGSSVGTAQGKLKRINKVVARVYESLMMKCGNENTQDEFNFRDKGTAADSFIPMFSGDQQVLQPSAWDRNGYVVITQAGPYPLTVIALVIHLTTSDYD